MARRVVGMLITAIKIPADPGVPVSAVELDSGDMDARSELVGGPYDWLNLFLQGGRLGFNVEGQKKGLLVNWRASDLFRLHASEKQADEIVLGDVLVTGGLDPKGRLMNPPVSYQRLLLSPGRFRVQVLLTGSEAWSSDPSTWDDWHAAYKYAGDLSHRSKDIRHVRVIRAD